MDTKSATIPVTLLEYLIEYASELRALWDWKVGSTERNDRDVAELEQMIEEAKRVVLSGSNSGTIENLRNELEAATANIRDLLDLIRLAHEWGANGIKGYSSDTAIVFQNQAASVLANADKEKPNDPEV